MLQLSLTELNNKTYDQTVAIHGISEDFIGQNWLQQTENQCFNGKI